MSFARAVARARTNYLDTPGLELTVPQAVHRWNLGLDDCRYVIDALVDAGFLKWTPKRTIVRTDHRGDADMPWDHTQVPVRRFPNRANSVPNE